MLPRTRSLLVACLAVAIAGCALAPVSSEIALRAQELGAPAAAGKARVVLFNGSNSLMFGPDGSGRINVYLNERGVAQLDIGAYVQLDLEPGKHDLKLVHKDVVTFTDAHVLEVKAPTTLVKVFCRVTSTDFELVDALPDGLHRRKSE